MGDGVERSLGGGWRTEVTTVDGVVHRSPKPQSRTVIALLGHLADSGFRAAPRPIGDGFAPDGREAIELVPGTSPQPRPWSDAAVGELGRLLRELHDATATFAIPEDAVWQPWFARDLPGDRPVIGHGDLGPWNILAVDGMPAWFVDWDTAGPVDAVWELAQVGWLNAQLHDDDVAVRNDLPSPEARARQLALLLDGYGLEPADRLGFVDKLVEVAVRSARDEAIAHAVAPGTPAPADDGYPILWGITWRARSAAWILDHRALLATAIGERR